MCVAVYTIMIMMIYSVSVIGKVHKRNMQLSGYILLCTFFICTYVGYLCGKCRNDTGVSALLDKCVSCGYVNILLIIALGIPTISYICM